MPHFEWYTRVGLAQCACMLLGNKIDTPNFGWLCCAVLCCAVLCCAVLCCAVLCCAVLCCAVLCSAVLCCAVLCCAVRQIQCPVQVNYHPSKQYDIDDNAASKTKGNNSWPQEAVTGPRVKQGIEKENNFQQPGEYYRSFDRKSKDVFQKHLLTFMTMPKCSEAVQKTWIGYMHKVGIVPGMKTSQRHLVCTTKFCCLLVLLVSIDDAVIMCQPPFTFNCAKMKAELCLRGRDMLTQAFRHQ